MLVESRPTCADGPDVMDNREVWARQGATTMTATKELLKSHRQNQNRTPDPKPPSRLVLQSTCLGLTSSRETGSWVPGGHCRGYLSWAAGGVWRKARRGGKTDTHTGPEGTIVECL